VPPGVDHELFVPRDRAQARAALDLTDKRIALYVGRLQAHKGPDVAVRTVAEAIARDPDATEDLVLVIVGGPSGTEKGAELSRLLELAGALGVRDRLVLVPPQPQAELADYYAAADVVLVPSRSESFGLVALEAQACGTPVVAARVGGLRYVVEDGRTGFLVEGHDPGDHAARVLEVLTDAELQRGLGARGAERALRFTWDATADAVLGVYREVLPAPVFSPLHRA
jgi:D-inositol-3-phosphate glycosyltransferase